MKHLIILAHPNPDSFCGAIANRARQAIEELGHSCQFRDLYALKFQPNLTLDELRGAPTEPAIKKEQDLVKDAAHLFFVFPVWWYDRPAILKGWIDRVLAYNFAYTVKDGRGAGLLQGKQATVYATFGSTRDDVAELHPQAEDWVMKAMSIGTLKYCGIEAVENRPLFAPGELSDAARHDILESVVVDLKARFGNSLQSS